MLLKQRLEAIMEVTSNYRPENGEKGWSVGLHLPEREGRRVICSVVP